MARGRALTQEVGARCAAIFLGHSEPVGRRLFVVALLVVAGSTLVATR